MFKTNFTLQTWCCYPANWHPLLYFIFIFCMWLSVRTCFLSTRLYLFYFALSLHISACTIGSVADVFWPVVTDRTNLLTLYCLLSPGSSLTLTFQVHGLTSFLFLFFYFFFVLLKFFPHFCKVLPQRCLLGCLCNIVKLCWDYLC